MRTKLCKDGLPTEEQECLVLVKYLYLKRYLFTHVPNGGFRRRIEAARFKALGLHPGVPDYLIFEATKDYCGVAIEMKRQKSARTSNEQRAWIARLNKRGWYAFVANGADVAIEQLKSIGL